MPMSFSFRRIAAGALVALPALAGCASVPPPVDQLAVSRAAVDQARAGGAVAAAPADYERALQRLQAAEAANRDERYREARRLAEEAEVDARAALAKADAEKSRQALAEVERSLQALRNEAQRGPR
jgi:hypothetical protein